MVYSADAAKAISDPNPCIDGRKANVNLAILGAKPRQIPGGEFECFVLDALNNSHTPC